MNGSQKTLGRKADGTSLTKKGGGGPNAVDHGGHVFEKNILKGNKNCVLEPTGLLPFYFARWLTGN